MKSSSERVLRGPEQHAASSSSERSLGVIVRSVVWQYPLILAVIAACIGVGVLYLMTATPVYEATARIQVSTEPADPTAPLGNDNNETRDFEFESNVDSQLHLVRSKRIALDVIGRLGEERLSDTSSGILSLVRRVFAQASGPADEGNSRTELAEGILDKMNAVRLGVSDVIDLSANADDPTLAADLANAFADSYIATTERNREQLSSAARSKAVSQIESMRLAARDAEKAVEAFKLENGIGSTFEERVLDEQIVQLSREISTRSAELYALENTYRNNLQVSRTGDLLSSPVGGVRSPLMDQLRVRYVELAREISDQSSRYGEQHPTQLRLRAQLDDIRDRLNAERQRILDEQKAKVTIAQNQLAQLEEELRQKQLKRQQADSATVTLRELEDEARALNTVYQELRVSLERNTFTENLGTGDAEIVERAQIPTRRVAPIASQVLILSALAGVLAGTAFAGARAAFTTRAITSDDVESATGFRHLASIPMIRNPSQLRKREAAMRAGSSRAGRGGSRQLRDTGGGRGGAGRDGDGNKRDKDVSRIAIDAPLSTFTESLRVLKSTWEYKPHDDAADRLQTKVILFSSAFPGEGKSTIASNVAYLDAVRGKRVLLIDCDTRNPRMTSLLAPNAKWGWGLSDYLTSDVALEQCLLQDVGIRPTSNFIPLVGDRHGISEERSPIGGALHFLPARRNPNTLDVQDYLGSSRLATLMAEARERYDVVYVDSPPLAPVIDTRLLVDHVDDMVLLVEWWKTPLNAVTDALQQARIPPEKILGISLNKMDERYRHQQYGQKKFHKYVGYGVS